MIPTVSIIMPAFNVESFIAFSIDSVISQTFTDWELLIVNDCSTDNTVEVVESYLSDSRIKLINNKKNLGGAGSRNIAIEVSVGRYIAFLDSDDLWTPDKLEKQLNFMKANSLGFTYSGYSTMSESGDVLDNISVPKSLSFKMLLKHNYIGCLTAVYDTEPYGKVFMPSVRKRQDFALWLELLKRFDKAYGIQSNLGFYRIRGSSLSSSKIDAFKYYWLVLRSVGSCSYFSACYNILCYVFIVFLKKKLTPFYNRML